MSLCQTSEHVKELSRRIAARGRETVDSVVRRWYAEVLESLGKSEADSAYRLYAMVIDSYAAGHSDARIDGNEVVSEEHSRRDGKANAGGRLAAASAETDKTPRAASTRAVAETSNNQVLASVILGRPGESCHVLGKDKGPLTDGQYAVITALLGAGAEGLTKDALENIRPSARRILRSLREKCSGWAAVILMPGQTNGRYRIKQ